MPLLRRREVLQLHVWQRHDAGEEVVDSSSRLKYSTQAADGRPRDSLADRDQRPNARPTKPTSAVSRGASAELPTPTL